MDIIQKIKEQGNQAGVLLNDLLQTKTVTINISRAETPELYNCLDIPTFDEVYSNIIINLPSEYKQHIFKNIDNIDTIIFNNTDQCLSYIFNLHSSEDDYIIIDGVGDEQIIELTGHKKAKNFIRHEAGYVKYSSFSGIYYAHIVREIHIDKKSDEFELVISAYPFDRPTAS